jgi:ribosomal protein S18 acetylase RimI-like enzyme
MDIRIAQYTDALAVARVHVLTWRAAYKDLLPREFLEKLSVDVHAERWQKAIKRGSPELWICERNREIVGWVAFGASRDPDAVEDVGEIEAIYVHEDAWATGVGRTLFERAKVRLRERGFKRFTLWVLADNTRAIKFYEIAGMVANHDQRKPVEIGQHPLYEVRYEGLLESY